MHVEYRTIENSFILIMKCFSPSACVTEHQQGFQVSTVIMKTEVWDTMKPYI